MTTQVMLKLLVGCSGSQSDFELTKLKASHQTAEAHDRRGELRRKLWRRIASRLAAPHSSGFSAYSHQNQFHSSFTELTNAAASIIYEKEAPIHE